MKLPTSQKYKPAPHITCVWDDLNTDPPRVNVILGRRFTAEEIREGSNVYLECQTRANPPIQRLTWMHNVSQYHHPAVLVRFFFLPYFIFASFLYLRGPSIGGFFFLLSKSVFYIECCDLFFQCRANR